MAAKRNLSATCQGRLRKREEGFVSVVIELINELLLKVIGSSHTGN